MDHLTELKHAVADGKLVAVLGAGVSLAIASSATPARSWPDLLRTAFSFANEAGHIDDMQHARWLTTLNSGDIDELLGAAEFVTRKLGGRRGLLYGRWLEEQFSRQSLGKSNAMKPALNTINKAKVPICTLNYDTLIERTVNSNSIAMNDTRAVLSWARRETNDVLHLHGLWSLPETIVLGISDYQEAVGNEFRSALQQSLGLFNRILFIGCGDTLYDPNFSSLLQWSREVLGASGLQHYALVRDGEVDAKLRDPAWQGLVRPLGYGRDHSALPRYIKEMFATGDVKKGKAVKRRLQDAEVIDNYRKQIVLDCGKMTIEGVRADADTAKQKFDLEKLFVPLAVSQMPPEFAPNDPDREQKLKDWHDKNPGAISFGNALETHNRLALLALPGGGKTLLLKRLAVAYADPSRRSATSDNLPDTDDLPLLIRCREWRNYITLPIPTMLARMADITGNNSLRGLFEALSARLKSGKVLLLVDGLDEIHSDSDRCIFVSSLESFLDQFPKVKLVVTSREAGFALVAPALVRFCTRWRIAPLELETIKLLCSHWHTLMGGSAPNATDEASEVFESIKRNDGLHRLAENPLLLTMLLVVKHGYGRLPPDRVTLYERAVEVLLDTWNIHGHAALNPREAVPQIAYVAFRLMEQGRQTATESELLALIEECRREVPLVRLYARDTPSDFLKRVELRSSLLLEAGKSYENGKIVPFYQFRHLTFQEYMAAIAAVEGHYSGYAEENSTLVPLKSRIVSEEWKEVVPMAAVLAKKRASAILNELINLGEQEEAVFFANVNDERYAWSQSYRMPRSISLLLQCLVEETEISQDNLDRSARLISTFAHGCRSQENWSALMRGPFGQTIIDEASRLFLASALPHQSWIRNSVALMAVYQKPLEFWLSNSGLEEIHLLLTSDDVENRVHGAAIVCGVFWQDDELIMPAMATLQPYLEANIIRDAQPYSTHAIWAIGMLFSRRHEASSVLPALSFETMETLKSLILSSVDLPTDIAAFAFSTAPLVSRAQWPVVLTAPEKARLRRIMKKGAERAEDRDSAAQAIIMLFYYANVSIRSAVAQEFLTRRSIDSSDSDLLKHYIKDEAIVNEMLTDAEGRRERILNARKKRRIFKEG